MAASRRNNCVSIDPYIEAWQLRDLVVRGELRPKEVAEFFLARIEKLNPTLAGSLFQFQPPPGAEVVDSGSGR